MINTETYSFQTDSEIVINEFKNNDNYLIEFDKTVAKEYCIVYFSSNGIYYPNDETTFRETIIDKNKYEWYGTRVACGHKHIFIRDIQKQWYIGGINSEINSPNKLFEFLKKETDGYKIIFVGSSAGGFASVIYGQLLNAERIYSLNGQFEILSILERSIESIDPLVFRLKNNKHFSDFYETRGFIHNVDSIYYFLSANSIWDIEQNDYVKDMLPNSIRFNSSTHGIPFLHNNLQNVLNLSLIELDKLRGKFFYLFLFSMKIVGFKRTVGYHVLLFVFYIKKTIASLKKWDFKNK